MFLLYNLSSRGNNLSSIKSIHSSIPKSYRRSIHYRVREFRLLFTYMNWNFPVIRSFVFSSLAGLYAHDEWRSKFMELLPLRRRRKETRYSTFLSSLIYLLSDHPKFILLLLRIRMKLQKEKFISIIWNLLGSESLMIKNFPLIVNLITPTWDETLFVRRLEDLNFCPHYCTDVIGFLSCKI